MAKFVVLLKRTSDPERPEVAISPSEETGSWSGMSSVDRYPSLGQLKDALVLLGKSEQEIEHELGKLRSQEDVTLLFDITEEQAKSFGWAGNP
jgi:hypothetical protein